MGMAEKDGGLPVFDTGHSKYVFLPTIEIAAWLPGKIGTHMMWGSWREH